LIEPQRGDRSGGVERDARVKGIVADELVGGAVVVAPAAVSTSGTSAVTVTDSVVAPTSRVREPRSMIWF